MNEAAFFESGDNFDGPARGGLDPLREGGGVARVAHGAGSDDPDFICDMQLDGLVEALERLDGGGHRVRRDIAGLEDTFAEPSHFTIFMQSFKLVL